MGVLKVALSEKYEQETEDALENYVDEEKEYIEEESKDL